MKRTFKSPCPVSRFQVVGWGILGLIAGAFFYAGLWATRHDSALGETERVPDRATSITLLTAEVRALRAEVDGWPVYVEQLPRRIAPARKERGQ